VYNSLTKIAATQFTSKVTSSLTVDPLTPILPDIPDISGVSYWDVELQVNVTEQNDFWRFKGELKLEDVDIGDKFTIDEGMLTVELGNDINAR
jgi:hypothetical protein